MCYSVVVGHVSILCHIKHILMSCFFISVYIFFRGAQFGFQDVVFLPS